MKKRVSDTGSEFLVGGGAAESYTDTDEQDEEIKGLMEVLEAGEHPVLKVRQRPGQGVAGREKAVEKRHPQEEGIRKAIGEHGSFGSVEDIERYLVDKGLFIAKEDKHTHAVEYDVMDLSAEPDPWSGQRGHESRMAAAVNFKGQDVPAIIHFDWIGPEKNKPVMGRVEVVGQPSIAIPINRE